MTPQPAVRCLSVLAAAGLTLACQAFSPGFAEFGGERVRAPRDRAAQRDAMLELRLELLLPRLLDRAGLDCWLLLADGPDGDPLLAQVTVTATRPEGKVAVMLCRSAGGVERLALGRGLEANAAIYEVVETGADAPLEQLLLERLRALDPARIGINEADSLAAADGLTATDARWLRRHLGDWAERLVSARPLVEALLATQLDVEAPLLAESARLTAAILDEVLSDRVVVAAGTSLADLEWAVRERAAAVDVELPFPPRTLVYRPGATLENERRMQMDLILQPGDLVFLSAGVSYLGYANRIGRWAYLLPSGERAAPGWIDAALGELADAAEGVAAALALGHDATEARAAAAAAVAGLGDGRAVVDRVARLREGAIDPRREAVRDGWGVDYRLAADTGLAITVQATVRPQEDRWGAVTMLSLDTVLLTEAGARFVVAPQRNALLID